jgi:SAM-dependent methyltransferase
MICRVCGSTNLTKLGTVEYYQGFSRDIYSCGDCGSRFTQHFEIAEALHANASSCYGLQREIAQRIKKFFDAKDLKGLGSELSRNSKYKFIIDAIAPYPKDARILEVGCSRGYLTSYFILAGWDITGADVSKSAIESANADFGNHFLSIGDPEIAQRALYDVIYHIGTIGCVADPLGLTRSLLKMLKPGGKLLFNAPNANACWLRGQLWIDFAPPPDVVTLYRPGFWTRTFSEDAFVSEEIENCQPEESFVVGLRKIMRRWKPPKPGSIEASLTRYQKGPDRTFFDKVWGFAERNALKAAKKTGALAYVPSQPTPYGYYITLTKRA